MNPAGAFIQIIFIVVAVGIGITYLQPTFAEIQSIQDDIQYYSDEIDKVQQVNSRLSQLVSQRDSMLRSDRLALVTYIPDEVDVLRVMKDVVAIGSEAEIEVSSITLSQGAGGNYFSKDAGLVPDTTIFTVAISAEYGELKTFLQLMEQNNYQLSVSELLLAPEDSDDEADDDMLVTLTLIAFSLPELSERNVASN